MFDAERYLESLEPLGMRFGLERIRKLVAVLGLPQHRFASVHVVGTNGKSSVAEITATQLEAHGVRSGAYLSPHVERWRERVIVAGAELGEAEFAVAVERVAEAVEPVNRTLENGDVVTQFEAATAAAFVALAAASVEVAVIEAGLGGRLDATNVLPSSATVLTSIGLEHTQWLGSTELEIAAEKLAVLRDHSKLIVGSVADDVLDLARRTAAERHAELVLTTEDPALPLAPYLRRNFALARAAAEATLGPLDPELVARVADGLNLHGRMEVVEGEPPVILDAAHNPEGARALAEALREVAGGREIIAAVAMLVDKDAAGFFAVLGPVLAGVVATEIPAERLARGGRPGARSRSARDVASAALAAGVGQVETVDRSGAAIARARELAVERGGALLITGSHYLLAYAPGD